MKALITGITGQDGSYLAELLLSKGYEVHGLVRRCSTQNTSRIAHIEGLTLHEGDMTDYAGLATIVQKIQPDEVYNLAAQSHVGTSFTTPEYTANVNALGAMRLLETLKGSKARYYQASTSELFGQVRETPQTEETPFHPRSPYGVAKLYAHWATVHARETGTFACNGILFNHESLRRGDQFVTRKITKGLARIFLGKQDCLYLGNLEAKRDWGHARDYVEAMWLMLQQDKPDDFVIATGKQWSVKDFIYMAAWKVGLSIEFSGTGVNEAGFCNGREVIKIAPEFYRPAEVETLMGNPEKAKRVLGWERKTTLNQLVEEMVSHDLEIEKSTN